MSIIKHNHKSYAVIIEISSFREPPIRAIKTVLRLSKYIKTVHIVSEVVTLRSKLYKSWNDHKKQLKTKHIELVHHSVLDMEQIHQNLVMYIPPTSEMLDATFLIMDRRTRAIRITNQPRHAIMPLTDFRNDSFSIWYVFFALIFVIDWWRNMLSWFTFHTEEHIRAEEILSGNKRVIIHPNRSPGYNCCGAFLWCYKSRSDGVGDRSPLIYAASGALCAPTRRINGMKYFLYRMHKRTSRGPGWKLWLIIATIYYLALGISWWEPIWTFFWRMGLGALGTITGTSNGMSAAIDLAHAFAMPFGAFRIGIMIVFYFIHTVIIIRHFLWPYHRIWIALLFPIVIPLFPLVLVYARLYQQHETWERGADTVEEYDECDLNDDDMDDTYYGDLNTDDDMADAVLSHSSQMVHKNK